MKRKEIITIAVIAAIAIVSIIALKLKAGSRKDSGYVCVVQHASEIVLEFDPMVDAVYQIDGDVGGLEVEVKEGKWHVINEKCPNHICASMGWMGIEDIGVPITCLPNNIVIYLQETPAK